MRGNEDATRREISQPRARFRSTSPFLHAYSMQHRRAVVGTMPPKNLAGICIFRWVNVQS